MDGIQIARDKKEGKKYSTRVEALKKKNQAQEELNKKATQYMVNNQAGEVPLKAVTEDEEKLKLPFIFTPFNSKTSTLGLNLLGGQ
jgi:formylmethanofuran dehydrogenase subunit D